jgi:hypothetical protein
VAEGLILLALFRGEVIQKELHTFRFCLFGAA